MRKEKEGKAKGQKNQNRAQRAKGKSAKRGAKSRKTELNQVVQDSSSTQKMQATFENIIQVKSKSVAEKKIDLMPSQLRLMQMLYILSFVFAGGALVGMCFPSRFAASLTKAQALDETGLLSIGGVKNVALFNPEAISKRHHIFSQLFRDEKSVPTNPTSTPGKTPMDFGVIVKKDKGGDKGHAAVVRVVTDTNWDEWEAMVSIEDPKDPSGNTSCLPLAITKKEDASLLATLFGKRLRLYHEDRDEFEDPTFTLKITAIIPELEQASVAISMENSTVVPVVLGVLNNKTECAAFYVKKDGAEIVKVPLADMKTEVLAPKTVALGENSEIVAHSWLEEETVDGQTTICPQVALFNGTKHIESYKLEPIIVASKAKYDQTIIPLGEGKLVQVVGRDMSQDGVQLSENSKVTVAIYDTNNPKKPPVKVEIPNAFFAGQSCVFSAEDKDGDKGVLLAYVDSYENNKLYLQHIRSDGSKGYQQDLDLPWHTVSIALNVFNMAGNNDNYVNFLAVTRSKEDDYELFVYEDDSWVILAEKENEVTLMFMLGCIVSLGAGALALMRTRDLEEKQGQEERQPLLQKVVDDGAASSETAVSSVPIPGSFNP